MVRSILAVLAGNISWAVLWVGSNAILATLFPAQYQAEKKDHAPMLLLLILLSFIFSIIAGYLTARIAARKEIAHTMVLGVLQLAMGIAAQLANYDALPLWYHIIFLLLLIPGNVFGAVLRARQSEASFA
jgi:hypothetical protein